jgi:hypothetical protein
MAEVITVYTSKLNHIRKLFAHLAGTCVLFLNGRVLKVSQLDLILTFFCSHGKQFWWNLHVHPSTFDALLRLIEDDPMFSSDSPQPQFPVEVQLTIMLLHFGHFGDAASVESVAQLAGCSAGVVVVCTWWVITALMALHDVTIHQLTMAQKAQAKEWVESVSCPAWHNGFCMVDGTLIILSDKPGHCGKGYFDWKSNYSINLTVHMYLPSSLYPHAKNHTPPAYQPARLLNHWLCGWPLWQHTWLHHLCWFVAHNETRGLVGLKWIYLGWFSICTQELVHGSLS